MNNKFSITIGINILVTLFIVVIAILTSPHWAPKLATSFLNDVDVSTLERPLADTVGKIRVVNEESAVTDVIEQVDPAVVSIIITKDLPVIEQGYDPFNDVFFNDPFVRNFFEFHQPQQRQQQQPKVEQQQVGGGTGFILTSDGLVVTNKHVVFDDEADYTVLMNDETKLPAEVIAKDPVNDIAVLRIKSDDKKDFPHLDLGDSDSLKVGQTVIAIGNALGDFRNTVSKGVVSGLARDVTAGDGRGRSEYLEGVIQTDAAINQGNSGGPLLNLQGQVIGVNVAVASGAENIGFSIPINSVKNTIETVKKNGKIVRPIIGVRYIMVTENLRKKNGLSVDHGAMVLRGESPDELAVMPGSPADKAGLEEYDIILEVNGNKIDGQNTLAREILKYQVGDKVKLKVLHDGKEKDVELELTEAPEGL